MFVTATPNFLGKIAEFVINVLEINHYNADAHIQMADTLDQPSMCEMDNNGNFFVLVQAGMDEKHIVKFIAHELVHVRQVLEGSLKILDEVVIWRDKSYPHPEFESDEYFLAPWEMEARALEDWVFHKWVNNE